MQFARRDIYNEKIKPIASEIFINEDSASIANADIDLFERFLKIIVAEVDLKLDKFRFIIPQQLYPYLSQLDKAINRHLSIKIDVASKDKASIELMEKVDEDGYGLAVEVKDQKVLDILPLNTEFVIVDASFIALLEEELPRLNKNCTCIASNVETYAQVEELKGMHVRHFSGSFLEQPEKIEVTAIAPNKTTILSLIAKLSTPDVELEEITKVILADSVICYKLLKIINSPLYRGVSEIKSVQDAIVRFGFYNLKKWVMLTSMCSLGGKPSALIKRALERAIMCGKLAAHLKVSETDIFYTAGLLSMIDAFLDHPIEQLLQEIQIAQEVKLGILQGAGVIGHVLSIVTRYQNGDVSFKDQKLTKIFIESSEETALVMKSLHLQ